MILVMTSVRSFFLFQTKNTSSSGLFRRDGGGGGGGGGSGCSGGFGDGTGRW